MPEQSVVGVSCAFAAPGESKSPAFHAPHPSGTGFAGSSCDAPVPVCWCFADAVAVASMHRKRYRPLPNSVSPKSRRYFCKRVLLTSSQPHTTFIAGSCEIYFDVLLRIVASAVVLYWKSYIFDHFRIALHCMVQRLCVR